MTASAREDHHPKDHRPRANLPKAHLPTALLRKALLPMGHRQTAWPANGRRKILPDVAPSRPAVKLTITPTAARMNNDAPTSSVILKAEVLKAEVLMGADLKAEGPTAAGAIAIGAGIGEESPRLTRKIWATRLPF